MFPYNPYFINTMCFLRLVLIVCLLGYGIDTRHKVINLELTAIGCCNCLIDTVSSNREVDTVNFSVLTVLYNLIKTMVQNEDLDYFGLCSSLNATPELMSFKLYSLTKRGQAYHMPMEIQSNFLAK